MATLSPSLDLTKITIPTREMVQKAIASELAKLHAAHSLEQSRELLGANWFSCAACKAGLNLTIAAPVAAAIAMGGGATVVIAGIATACGLAVPIVEAIIATVTSGGAAAVEGCISKLCKEMKAC